MDSRPRRNNGYANFYIDEDEFDKEFVASTSANANKNKRTSSSNDEVFNDFTEAASSEVSSEAESLASVAASPVKKTPAKTPTKPKKEPAKAKTPSKPRVTKAAAPKKRTPKTIMSNDNDDDDGKDFEDVCAVQVDSEEEAEAEEDEFNESEEEDEYKEEISAKENKKTLNKSTTKTTAKSTTKSATKSATKSTAKSTTKTTAKTSASSKAAVTKQVPARPPRFTGAIEKVRLPSSAIGGSTGSGAIRRVGLSRSAPARPLSPDPGFKMGCLLSLWCGVRQSNQREGVLCNSTTTPGANSGATASANAGANEIFSEPLKRIDFNWQSPGQKKYTKQQLERERVAFWETCYAYGGRQEVWNALKMVCTEELHNDLNTARVVLQTAGVILPTGLLTEIYDESGFRYCLPAFCVCDPVDVINDGSGDNLGDTNESQVRTIKVRLSTGKDLKVQVDVGSRVSDLKSQVASAEGDINEITIVWLGRRVEDDEFIDALGVPKDGIIQALVTK